MGRDGSTWNGMDHLHRLCLTAAGTCVTGEAMSRERLAKRTRQGRGIQCTHLDGPYYGPVTPPHVIAEQQAREDERMRKMMLEVQAKLEKQFGAGAVMVSTSRSPGTRTD